MKKIMKLTKFHHLTKFKEINNERKKAKLYKDIVLVTSVRIFCTTLFTNNNIKVVIQMHTFLMDQNY